MDTIHILRFRKTEVGYCEDEGIKNGDEQQSIAFFLWQIEESNQSDRNGEIVIVTEQEFVEW